MGNFSSSRNRTFIPNLPQTTVYDENQTEIALPEARMWKQRTLMIADYCEAKVAEVNLFRTTFGMGHQKTKTAQSELESLLILLYKRMKVKLKPKEKEKLQLLQNRITNNSHLKYTYLDECCDTLHEVIERLGITRIEFPIQNPNTAALEE